MARNGSGVYSLPAGNPVVTLTAISSTWANGTMTDLGNEITNSIDRSGRTVALANLPMGGFKHTGVADANASGQYLNYGQSNAVLTGLSVTGTLSAVTANLEAASIRPGSTGGSNLGLSANGTGQFSIISIYNSSITAAQVRWALGKGNTTESGANAGSDFFINNYSDTGVLLASVVQINRATGIITLSAAPTGTGITNLFASPPAIGGTTRAAGTFTSLDATGLSVRPTSPGDSATSLCSNGLAASAYVNIFNSSVIGTNLRWQLIKNGVAESGSNAGSDFQINCYSDTGVYLNSPIQITRATGTVTLALTQPIGDNSTRAATTAYADRAAFTGATWQDVTGSRTRGTSYTNSTGRAIQVFGRGTSSASGHSLSTQSAFGTNIGIGNAASAASQAISSIPIIIPPGGTYTVADIGGTATSFLWYELRT